MPPKNPTKHTKLVIRPGDLQRLEGLLSRAERLTPQLGQLAREIVAATRGATDAIINYRQAELAIPDTREPQAANPKATRMGRSRKAADK